MERQQRLEQLAIKRNRARELYEMVCRGISEFLETVPYRVEMQRNAESRCPQYVVTRAVQTPPKLAAMVGDVLHNLRSLLDHAAYHIVCAGMGEEPRHRVYFPIAEDKGRYITKRQNQLKGATEAAVAVIDEIRPYKGGNDLIWGLHKLDIVDKHRKAIMTGGAFRSFDIGGKMRRMLQNSIATKSDWQDAPDLPVIPVRLRPADRKFPLKVGDVLFVDRPDEELDDSLTFYIELAFGEPGIMYGEPIIQTLTDIGNLVDGVIEKLHPHIG